MNDISDYSEYRELPLPRNVHLADGSATVKYIGSGTVTTTMWVHGQETKIILQDVLHSLDIAGRFISIRKLREKVISTTFKGSQAIFTKDGEVCAEGALTGQQYWLSLQNAAPSIYSMTTAIPVETLHARLGHLSWTILKHFYNEIEPNSKHVLSMCEGCLLGKST